MTEVRQALCVVYENVFRQLSVFAQLPELSVKADGLNNRAVSYLSLGREEDAVQCWQEALKEDPQHFEATYNYGYFRWRKGEIADDVYVRQMQALEGIKGTDPDYWRCLAWVHFERGDIEAVEGIQQSEHRAEDEDLKQALSDKHRPVGRPVRTFEGHAKPVNSVCFSPDGRYALSGSGDRAIRLWEVESGREVRRFAEHTSYVTSVCFSPDGRYVLSGSGDNTIRLWEFDWE